MAPIRRRKKVAADQALTCLDALRLLDISRDVPTLKGTGHAGDGEATASPAPQPPLPQEVEVDAEPETSKLPSPPPPPPPQEVEVGAELETPKHSPPLTTQEVEMEPAETSELPSPPPPQEVEVDAELETPKHSSPPPPSQEVEMEPETSKHSSPPPPSQEAEVEAEPETPKHSSPPPPPQEVEAEAESDMSKHIKAVLKAMLDMAALPDYDERYGDYLGDFFNDLIQTPRPIDPLWLPEPEAAGLGPTIAGRYPYLAGEVARTTGDDTAEQREMLGRGLLQEVDAAWLAALEGEFHEATWAGKKAMLAKLEAEVQYAKARIDAEAMIEMLLGAGEAKASSSV